jgi:hypothetical protein
MLKKDGFVVRKAMGNVKFHGAEEERFVEIVIHSK